MVATVRDMRANRVLFSGEIEAARRFISAAGLELIVIAKKSRTLRDLWVC